MEKPRI